MKNITMDFETYEKEKRNSYSEGYDAGQETAADILGFSVKDLSNMIKNYRADLCQEHLDDLEFDSHYQLLIKVKAIKGGKK